MTDLKSILAASALALVIGVSAPAFACEDCDKHTKDGKKTEAHDHKDGDHKDHSKHEGKDKNTKEEAAHDHKEGDNHDHKDEKK